MSSVEVAGTMVEVIELLLADDVKGPFFAASIVLMEKAVTYFSAALGDANRFSGRLCSKLYQKYNIIQLQRGSL